MAEINFPNSSSPLVHIGSPEQIDGTLTQTGQYLLQALWNAVFNADTPIVLAMARFSISGGVVTLLNSFNIKSITRVSTGIYTVVFNNPLPDADYIFIGNSYNNIANTWMELSVNAPVPSATGFQFNFLTVGPALADPGGGQFVVIEQSAGANT